MGHDTAISTDVTLRPIVVGVTEDDRSDAAIRMGWRLATRFAVPLELVHSVPEAHAGDGDPASESRRALAGRIDELVEPHGEQRPSDMLAVRTGKPHEVLIERARDLDAGLIVLGPHRRRGRLDFSGTAGSVLAHATCAVWCQRDEPKRIQRVLVPIDFSEDSLGALDQACRLARRLDASITVMTAFADPDFAYPPHGLGSPTYVVEQMRDETRAELEKLVQGYAWDGLAHETCFVEGDPTAAILDAQDSADLIVMATHGRGAVARAILGSVTYAVLKQARIPVLGVRHPARMPTR